MTRFCLFVAAIVVVYIGGFVYEQVGPVFYAVVITLIASTPLLLKFSFWKKIVLMIPLLVLRVLGKILLNVFGKNALSKLLAKYGLLERRFNTMVETVAKSKNQGIDRWKNLHRSSQAYLLLIFFPVAIAIFVLALIIEFVRLRFLRFFVEKLMHSFVMKWTANARSSYFASRRQSKISAKIPNKMLDNDANPRHPNSANVDSNCEQKDSESDS